MDEDTRQGRQAVEPAAEAERSKTPEDLRREIEQTREELGDTVEALGHKTDVKAQARERITAIKDTAQHKRDEAMAKAKSATPESAAAGARQVTSKAQSNPLPFAVAGALAAGFLLGRLTAR